MKIKLVFLDVDGVLVNKKFPLSSPETIISLKKAQSNACRIILTTAKPGFSKDVMHIIKSADLNNYHITFAGALIYNPLSNKILQKKNINPFILNKLLQVLMENKLFIELETAKNYYLVQTSHWSGKNLAKIAEYRKILFGKTGKWISNNSNINIIKIITSAEDLKQKKQVTDLLFDFKCLNLSWAQTPQTGKIWWGMITDSSVSKKNSTQLISKHYKIPLRQCLSVGDSLSDWEFMSLCGSVATMDDSSYQLKKLIKERENNFFISSSVDNNGIVQILDAFTV